MNSACGATPMQAAIGVVHPSDKVREFSIRTGEPIAFKM
jgi:hypothetical protein